MTYDPKKQFGWFAACVGIIAVAVILILNAGKACDCVVRASVFSCEGACSSGYQDCRSRGCYGTNGPEVSTCYTACQQSYIECLHGCPAIENRDATSVSEENE